MSNYSPRGFNLLPDVVKNLLIINGLFFLATFALQAAFDINLVKILGLYFPKSDHFEPYQLITHIFMHGGLAHIFFNMFALWMFGSVLENVMGPQRFFIYYFVTGFGAAALHLGVNYFEYISVADQVTPEQMNEILNEGQQLLANGQNYANEALGQLNLIVNTPTVGASGAVFGLLGAFGLLFPNSKIYIYFLFPIKAKYFVFLYGALELYSGIANRPGDNVAHFAHLGGMLFGFILLKIWGMKRIN